MERRPRLTVRAAVNTLSRELIVLVFLALAAVTLSACGGGVTVVLKSPLSDKCKEAGLKKCQDMEDGVLAYAGGERQDSKKKIADVVAANEPQRVQQFADALASLADLPGLGATSDTIRELADFLRGEKSDTGGKAPAPAAEGIAGVMGGSAVAAGTAASAPSEPVSVAPDHARIEVQARALQKKAMDEDYLSVNFDKAADKLNQAVTKCGANHCAANLRALIRRDLSVVLSAANKRDLALASMTEALKADGTIQLDPNFKTKEIEAIYIQARKSAGGVAVAVVASGGKGGGGGSAPTGDFTHTPADEQAIRTPLPIYVEYGGSEALAKVVVKYKAFGMPDFKTFELKKMGDGWGGALPCADMLEGDIQYYLQGFSATNDPVATGGDRNNTYKVSIKKAIASEPSHLPGQVAPTQCAESADCPPDFPGCKKGGAADLLGAGADCAEDGQCKSGSCKDEKCAAPPDEGATGERPKLHRVWLGVGVAFDFDFISATTDVCKLDPKSGLPLNAGYFCTFQGNDFPSRSDKGVQNGRLATGQGAGDAIAGGGPNPGNLRIAVSFDYALNYNLLVGARAGWSLLTYPGQAASAFPPLYLEARLTWVIGKDALATSGFAPVFFLGAGVAQFSTSVAVPAALCPAGDTALKAGLCTTAAGVTVNPVGGSVVAWRVGGPVFAAPGGGIRYAFSAQAAAILDLKLDLAFGSGFIFAPSPELGFQYGF